MNGTARKHSIALQEIMEGVKAIDIDSTAKQKFLQLVGAIAETHGFGWIERANRVAFARDLLRSRVPRPEIRTRLMELYGISQPQAYRVITYALQRETGD